MSTCAINRVRQKNFRAVMPKEQEVNRMSSPENTALRRGRLALAAIAALTLLLPACKEAVTRGAVSSSSSGSSNGAAPTTVPWYPPGKN